MLNNRYRQNSRGCNKEDFLFIVQMCLIDNYNKMSFS